MTETEILLLAGLVAAYVGVVKRFGIAEKWLHLVAIGFAAVFVLLPGLWRETIVYISIIALTASGAYNYVKKPENDK